MFKVKILDQEPLTFDGDAYDVDARSIKLGLSQRYPVLESIPGDGEWEGETLVFSRPQGGTKG